jgi:hypothetical protein
MTKKTPPSIGQFALSERDDLLAKIAEQAREIERLRGYEGEWERLLNVQAAELAALKAQPGAVVLPDPDEIMQMAFEEGQPAEDASGYYFELEEFDLFVQRLLDEVTRLNAPSLTVEPAHSDAVSVPRELLELIDEAMCDFLGEDDPLRGDLRALLAGGRL